jgi:hypothetical protein
MTRFLSGYYIANAALVASYAFVRTCAQRGFDPDAPSRRGRINSAEELITMVGAWCWGGGALCWMMSAVVCHINGACKNQERHLPPTSTELVHHQSPRAAPQQEKQFLFALGAILVLRLRRRRSLDHAAGQAIFFTKVGCSWSMQLAVCWLARWLVGYLGDRDRTPSQL